MKSKRCCHKAESPRKPNGELLRPLSATMGCPVLEMVLLWGLLVQSEPFMHHLHRLSECSLKHCGHSLHIYLNLYQLKFKIQLLNSAAVVFSVLSSHCGCQCFVKNIAIQIVLSLYRVSLVSSVIGFSSLI